MNDWSYGEIESEFMNDLEHFITWWHGESMLNWGIHGYFVGVMMKLMVNVWIELMNPAMILL